MKKEEVFKKAALNALYIVVFLLLLSGISILVSRSIYRENSNIVYAQEGYRNINPKFSVDFSNGGIRFESSKSYRNPFEGKEANIWEKIQYFLGIDSEKKGLEIVLEEVSYDQRMEEMTNTKFQYAELGRNFELIQSGKDIYNEEKDSVSKDTIISKEVYRGVDIEYQVIDGKGLKEEIILQDLIEYTTECEQGECRVPVNRYVFRVTLDDGLQLRRSVTGTEEFPAGTQYITDKNGNYFAHFLPEFAKDAVGNKTSDIYVNISPTDKENEYIYELIVDAQWLLSSERVFPVMIDPSIVHDSSLSFDIGTYEKTVGTATNTIDLQNGYLSGEYISSVLPLGDNATLDNIIWTVLGAGTRSGDIPYSRLGLILEENFDDTQTEKARWGPGSLVVSQSRNFSVSPGESTYFAVEFWVYQTNENTDIDKYILRSNLGNISVKNGFYTVGENITTRPVEYDSWQHIAVVFDVGNGKINMYVDGQEEQIPFEFTDSTLRSVTVGGDSSINGYIDTLRAYDRLLTKYEIASNTQYSRLYFTYRTASSQDSWSEWRYNASLTPEYEQREDGVYINTDSVDIREYNLLSFLYAGQDEEEIYITEEPVEDSGYVFKPVFTASLTGTLVDTSDKEIYIKEKGSTSNYIDNLNTGDTLIVQSDEYSLEGVVVSVNNATGLVEVGEWIGNIPNGGFIENTDIYKWQREYISLFDYKGGPFVVKGEGKVKDIQLLSAYEESVPLSNSEVQYLQYKFVFTTTKPYLTPHLSSVNINYSSAGPRMDQILRHGKWFNEEGKQPFWWAR